MISQMLESEMVAHCYDYLKTLDELDSVVQEVPFLSRCIDMVIKTNKQESITIEFKIKNWRHTI
jgi:hypothetical protein